MIESSMTVLAVDDDPEDLEIIEEALQSISPGIIFHKLSRGRDILPFLEKLPNFQLPNLIVLDYNIPELTGAEIISLLDENTRYRTIPKVIMSTSNAASHVEACIAAGARQYFVKPSSFKDFNRIVKQMLSICG